MKGTIVWGIAAALLAVVGVVCLRIATVERQLADAQQDLATLNYARAAQSLDEAEASIGLARWVPGFGVRRASTRCARAAARCSTGSGSTTSCCPRAPIRWRPSRKATSICKLIVANAVYRQNQRRYSGSRRHQAGARGVGLRLLRGAEEQRVARGRRLQLRVRDPAARRAGQGQAAARGRRRARRATWARAAQPSEATSQKGFQIYIPLESQEKPLGGDAGKAPPKDRKG